MPDYLIVGDAIPQDLADAFDTLLHKRLEDDILPRFTQNFKDRLPQGMDCLKVSGSTLLFGQHKVKVMLLPRQTPGAFRPIQDRVNDDYLKTLAESTAEAKAILARSGAAADYGFWSGLPAVLDQMNAILGGDVSPKDMVRLRAEFTPYFCLEHAAYLKRRPGTELFKPLLSILLVLNHIFIVPESILGNFFPDALTGGDCSVIEFYADGLEDSPNAFEEVISHEFFHFFHYACVAEEGGQWLSYNRSFQENLAVIESLARYFDGSAETIGAFPGNPYFGANYLRLFELLGTPHTPVRFRQPDDGPVYLKNELSPSEAAMIHDWFTRISGEESDALGGAFRQLFDLSLEDMAKAYRFIDGLRDLCLTKLALSASAV
jgi:hypothetical protein